MLFLEQSLGTRGDCVIILVEKRNEVTMPRHPLNENLTPTPRRRSAGLICFGLMAVLALGGLTSPATAQTVKKAVKTTDTLTTADGWAIPITYYQSTAGKDAAVVILLHGEGQNQLVWEKNNLATRLQEENFAVITCDLRKHGEAKNPRADGDKSLNANDYKIMGSATNASELETIQAFLFDEHQAQRLNMAKTAIVAADNLAPVALSWAMWDWMKKPYSDAPTLATRTPRGQTVRGIVLLSPSENVPGLSSAPAMKFYRLGDAVAMLFLNGTEDGSARDVRNMIKQVTTPKNKSMIYSESFATKLKGSDLIGRVAKAEPLTVGLLKKHVQDLKVEWQDRRSRLER